MTVLDTRRAGVSQAPNKPAPEGRGGLPGYTNQQQLNTGFVPRINTSAFAAPGRGVAAVGNAIGDLAGALNAHNKNNQDYEAALGFAKLQGDLQRQEFAHRTTHEAPDGTAYATDWNIKANHVFGAFEASLTEEQRQKYAPALQGMKDGYSNKAATHQYGKTQKYQKDQFNNSYTIHHNLLLKDPSDEQYENSLLALENQIDARDIPEPQKARDKATLRRQLDLTRALAYSKTGQFDKAEAVMEGLRNEYKDAASSGQKSIVGYSRDLNKFKVANRSDGKKVDVAELKPVMRDKLSQLQQRIGKQLTINSGYRDPKHNAKVGGAKGSRHMHRDAVDLQWPKNATIQEKQQIIAHAKALNFKGFGIGNGILHLDMGRGRFWGYKNGKPTGNIPGWAVDALSGKMKIAKNSAGGVQGQIANAAKKAGLDPEYMIRLASSESSFRPGVKADTSSATGLFQITGDTAKRLGTSHGKKSVDQEISDGIAITKANQKTMTNYLGRAPRNDELHLAHVFGAGRANGILSAKNETPIHKVLPPEVIKANEKGIFKNVRNVGQLKAWAKAKQSTKVDVASYIRSEVPAMPEKYKATVDKIDKFIQEARIKHQDTELVRGLIRGEIELNPYDKESNQKLDKSLVNAETANRILNGDDELLQGLSLFAIKQRKAPKPFVEGLMGLARSNDPKNKIKAYTAVDQIFTQSPHAFEQSANGKKLLKEAETYRFLVQDRGYSSEKAIERIELMKDPEFQKGRELREREANKAAESLTSEGLLDDLDVENWIGSNYDINSFPNAELLLMDQYKKVFVDAFAENGGDAEMAKNTAQKVIAKDYGLSSITGRTEFMRNPPEKIYPSIGGSHEYITEQLGKDVVDYLGLKQDEFDLNNVMLRADRRTGKEINSGKLPSYNVIYRDDEGVLQRLPGRWAPDMKEAETERNILQKATRKLEKESNSSPYHPHNLVRKAMGLEPVEVPAGFLKKYDQDDIDNKVKEIKKEKASKIAAP